MNYGRAVMLLRALRNRSQSELAEACDLHPSYMSLIETGRRTPSLDTLTRIAQALDVPLHALMAFSYERHEVGRLTDEQKTSLGAMLLTLVIDGALPSPSPSGEDSTP